MRSIGLLISALALSACVSESEVYQRNLQPAYLSPLARRLPKSELEQIARVMAHITRQSIVGICGPRNPKYFGQLMVYTAYPGATERGGFGLFSLEKKGSEWRVVEGGTDLDPWMVNMVRNGL
jgi:hypothetical protein